MRLVRLAVLGSLCSTIASPVAAFVLIFSDGFESGNRAAWDPPTYCPATSTFTLTAPGAAVDAWTVPAAQKVRTTDLPPAASSGTLRLFAARNEFEPLVVALHPPAADAALVSATLAPFAGLGPGATVDLRQATYTGDHIEALQPLVARTLHPAEAPLVLWVTIYVPADAPPGLHTSTLTVDFSNRPDVVVPVELYVFNALLPPAATFQSQLPVTFTDPADARKQLLFDHRLTPATPTWPSGFRWNITWDQNVHPATRCTTFDDETDHEPNPDYALGDLAQEWLLGSGWNGVGFPSAELFRFVSNSEPRPPTFCGIPRETGTVSPPQWGSAAYNAEWSDFLGGLENYLQGLGLLSKTFYYAMNEPANATDYNLAAHLCRLTAAAAPGLRLAISEEPKPEIAENAAGACGYDLWLAHFGELKRSYAAERMLLGEEVWLYSLAPDFWVNPTVTARQGSEVRMLPWIAWAERVRGWSYYDGDSFFSLGNSTVRLELLREGFEDYEYLVLANGGEPPRPGVVEVADRAALSAAHSEIDWNHDADAQAALRCELGRYLEGHRTDMPALQLAGTRPRAEYYINFQPCCAPTNPPSPLVFGGHTWIQIGWNPWSDALGYGWRGPNQGNPGILLAAYDITHPAYNILETTYIWDDFGRENLFEFDLENGRYLVTVGVGRGGLGNPDPHNAMVEGIRVVDQQVLSDITEASTEVELTDGRLSLVIGGRSDATGDWAYTFLAYLTIVPVP
jgi:hypothetical protein